jgi:trans-2-enoyl-CoA reductase
VNAAQSYDAVLTAKPEQIFQKLAQAHSDLTKALNNDEVSWDRAFASLESVKSDAKKLEGIVSALLAAARTEER